MRVNLESLVCDLPEDIEKKKWAGDIPGALRAIDARLKSERTTDMMKERLTLEKARIGGLLRRFTYTREAAIQKMRSIARDFTPEEFDALEDEGCVDFLYVNGQKMYLSSFAGTLVRMRPDLAARRLNPDPDDDRTRLLRALAEMREKGELRYCFRVKSALSLDESAFIPGETYTAHLPVPAESAQQPRAAIRVFADADGVLSAPDAPQRTVCYTRKLAQNAPFGVEYEYESHVKYVDPFSAAPRVVYPDAGEPCADDLSEQAPHILFTPYLYALSQKIAGDETRPLLIARKIYEYVTQNVRYSFMRPYRQIDRQAEYAAINLKGDCGIQALLFIALCRMLGVPARWQSGLTADESGTGCHDWAQFYTEEFGWLFADPSFGGSAWRAGDLPRWNFYFGNLDPFRMVANRRYQAEFDPPKSHERADPYDNQDGEMECAARGFEGFELDTQNEVRLCRKLS